VSEIGFRTYHVEEETTAADREGRNGHDVVRESRFFLA
jgi:hypothetical protein